MAGIPTSRHCVADVLLFLFVDGKLRDRILAPDHREARLVAERSSGHDAHGFTLSGRISDSAIQWVALGSYRRASLARGDTRLVERPVLAPRHHIAVERGVVPVLLYARGRSLLRVPPGFLGDTHRIVE